MRETAQAIPIRKPTFTVVNPQAEPTDQWIRVVARLLLDAADKRLAERAAGVDHQDQKREIEAVQDR